MKTRQYRIESKEPLLGRLLPTAALKRIYANPSLAVAIAVKSVLDPSRQQVRVVDVDSGEIVFETRPAELMR